MPDPNFIILYVENPIVSGRFYADLLQKEPVEASPSFVLFALQSGVMLGLWSRAGVKPLANGIGGGGEIAIAVEAEAEVTALHESWMKRAVPIVQPPCRMDFGYTFLALDPDQHRIRVFSPA